MKKIFLTLLLLVPMGISSCTKGYVDINKNPLYPGDEEKERDGVAAGAYFTNFQKKVMPTRASGESTDLPNEYQVSINLAGDNWVGYFSPVFGNKWNGGVNFTTYNMLEGWVNYSFSTVYTGIVNPWLQILQQTHTKEVKGSEVTYVKKSLADQAVFSVAQIIKIMGLHRATDMFGPIPYLGIGKGDLTVAYDSQEVIYKSFFEELQTAVNTLQEYQRNGAATIEAIKDFDAIYFGDVPKWMKLANSLMLRLAVRVRYVDQALAQKWASQALTNPGGVMESAEDAAKLNSTSERPFINSLELLWNGYSDCRVGATIACYMSGYSDPRVPKYFAKYPKDPDAFTLKAVRTGIYVSTAPDTYLNYSIPNVQENTPVYWMRPAEVYFLRAEAALFHLTPGNAEELYKKGIQSSFDEYGVSSKDYITSPSRPTAYRDGKNSAFGAPAPSSVSVRWSDASGDEERLEKIITQKYIALYPDGQEAWTEWRRTGYPKQITAYTNRTTAAAGNVLDSDGYKNGVRRLPFPRSEYDGINKENVTKAVSLLSSGIDDSNAHLWWDANPLLK